MSWADHLIEQLARGRTVSFRPTGDSMEPRIRSGQLCTVAPVDPYVLQVGDIVLCRVERSDVLHAILAIDEERFLIGNNRGKTNGWTDASLIYGLLVRVDD